SKRSSRVPLSDDALRRGNVKTMLSFDEAEVLLLHAAPRLPSETVTLSQALGCVLAETVCAPAPMPPHDYSAMDGYAVSDAAFTGAAPWEMAVVGESRTGQVAPALVPGSACRIFTGAPIPEGASAVVMQENVERDGDRARFAARPRPMEN